MNEERLYFAYGSNINLNQMAFRCPAATLICPVVLENYELTFRGGGVATIIPAEGKQVPGLLWELTPECEKALDHYEGHPHYYGKEQITVTDKNGVEYNVMVYVMTPQFSRESTEIGCLFGCAVRSIGASPAGVTRYSPRTASGQQYRATSKRLKPVCALLSRQGEHIPHSEGIPNIRALWPFTSTTFICSAR